MIEVFLLGGATIVCLLLDVPTWVFTIIIMGTLIDVWWSQKLVDACEDEVADLFDRTADIVHDSIIETETWYKYLNETAQKFTIKELEWFNNLTENELNALYNMIHVIANCEESEEE